jgi:pimeloyl-ACP methyl ester carboxylesterase
MKKPSSLAEAMIRPRRSARSNEAPEQFFSTPHGDVALYFRGPSDAQKRVLLLHGWEDDHSFLDPVAKELVKLGLRCRALDLPAHGASSGDTIMIPEAAEVLLDLDRSFGPFHLCVGHSIGAATIAVALTRGLRTQKVALLTPPTNYARHIASAALAAGAPAILVERAMRELRRRCPTIDMIEGVALAKQMSVPALIVVAGRDAVVDPEESRRLVAAWEKSELLFSPESTHASPLREGPILRAVSAYADF